MLISVSYRNPFSSLSCHFLCICNMLSYSSFCDRCYQDLSLWQKLRQSSSISVWNLLVPSSSSLFNRAGILIASESLLQVLVMHFELSYEFHQNIFECYPAINKVAFLSICISFPSPVFTFHLWTSEVKRVVRYLYPIPSSTYLLWYKLFTEGHFSFFHPRNYCQCPNYKENKMKSLLYWK